VGSRREARRTAIDILYQADVTGADALDVLRDWDDAERSVVPFARELVEGTAGAQVEVDVLLAEHAQGWTVERMAALDRTILRVAIYELLHRPDVPQAAAISEAVEAAGELSAEESRRFVNGILGKIARELGEGRSGDRPGD
jgi:transcription antitermination protein NusB